MPNPAPILLIAPTGMLGRAWRELLEQHSIAHETVGRPAFDLADPPAIPPHIRTVVNCAAWTDVDGAEAHEADAMAINGTGVGRLAQRCREAGAKLVHYSTDYVFDGSAASPYSVDHPRRPINAYGRTKARGEELLQTSGADHLLIRTAWVYAPWGKNFVRTIHAAAGQRDALKVVNDQHGRPTSAQHLAAVSLALLQARASGVYHVTDGGEPCTWYDFAAAIAQHANPACRVEPCTSDQFPRPAPRPAYSVLDLTKTEDAVGPLVDWRSALGSVLDRITGSTGSTG